MLQPLPLLTCYTSLPHLCGVPLRPKFRAVWYRHHDKNNAGCPFGQNLPRGWLLHWMSRIAGQPSIPLISQFLHFILKKIYQHLIHLFRRIVQGSKKGQTYGIDSIIATISPKKFCDTKTDSWKTTDRGKWEQQSILGPQTYCHALRRISLDQRGFTRRFDRSTMLNILLLDNTELVLSNVDINKFIYFPPSQHYTVTQLRVWRLQQYLMSTTTRAPSYINLFPFV